MSEIINLESDDEAPPPQETPTKKSGLTSPFGKSATKPATDERFFKFLHIKTDKTHDTRAKDSQTPAAVGLNGLILFCVHPNHEWDFLQPVFQQMQVVFNEVHVLPKVFDFYISGILQKQSKNSKYAKRCLVWICPEDTQDFNNDGIQWIYDTYMQYVTQLSDKNKTIMPFDVEKDVEVINSWSKYMRLEDFQKIRELSWLSSKYAGLKSFFRYSKNNVYSFWPVGEVPVSYMEKFKLRSVLAQEDLVKWAQHNEKYLTNEQKEKSNLHDKGVDTPTESSRPTLANPFATAKKPEPERDNSETRADSEEVNRHLNFEAVASGDPDQHDNASPNSPQAGKRSGSPKESKASKKKPKPPA